MSKIPNPFRASLQGLMSAADRMDQSPNYWGKWEGMMLSAMIMEVNEIPCPDPAKIKDFGTWRSFLAHVIVLASAGDVGTAKILMTEEEASFDPVQFKSWQRAA